MTALQRTPISLAAVDDALAVVQDTSLPIEQRAPSYAVLRRMRLQIDRAIRSVGQEIQAAMAAVDATEWGPIRLSWKAVDARYPANDEGNWDDDGVQSVLSEWAANPRYQSPDGTPWVIRIPAHCEIATAALGAAIAAGDPAARELYRLIREKDYRTEEGRTATLAVVELRAAA